MQKLSEEALVAYLDGELDAAERRLVEDWLDAEPAAHERLLALAASASLVRSAFDEVLNEAVPERLVAAARGETGGTGMRPGGSAPIIPLSGRKARTSRVTPGGSLRHWGVGLPAAAALAGLLVGGSAGFFGSGLIPVSGGKQRSVEASNNGWLDNAAGDYKLLVSAGDTPLIDVPATNDTREALQKISQSLPQAVRLPDLKPWGLAFRGARLVVVEGRPAVQLVYTTENKAIGPLALIIGSSKQPDLQPAFDHRQDVNLLYWRHQGRAYALVGQTDIGYLWGIANDIAWQLDAI
jgi:anti-sigma factor RsiW